MNFKINPLFWSLLIFFSPILILFLLLRSRTFEKNQMGAFHKNKQRIQSAKKLKLPPLKNVKLTVLTEFYSERGYRGAPGVSYFFQTDQGTLLYDIGFGSEKGVFAHNLKKSGINPDNIDALCISHLHPDHMGGLKASRLNKVILPLEIKNSLTNKSCFLPDKAETPGMIKTVVSEAMELCAGIFSTGPLARSLFFFGWTEEQALLFKIKNKGIVVVTGCGHPTIEVILQMVEKVTDEPIYAIMGGLHFPLKKGRGNYLGIQAQMIFGTGKNPIEHFSIEDITRTITAINKSGAKKVFLSAHDTCDFSINIFKNELNAEVSVLKSGNIIQF